MGVSALLQIGGQQSVVSNQRSAVSKNREHIPLLQEKQSGDRSDNGIGTPTYFESRGYTETPKNPRNLRHPCNP